ncbi:hypothetical protein ACFQPA_09275 [Halomarina halobia]|uniref:DUF3368 domain-containing protein n=1 Tax=Halomarina halobia TaxID=3033386 RepID=A0ABD6AAW1_9EURY|nr:hypothetical protein [Halomarina sp. PSR21]
MIVLLDATTLISLGTARELDVLHCLDGELTIPSEVLGEVTTEPARSQVERFTANERVRVVDDVPFRDAALSILGDDEVTGDAQIVGLVRRVDARGDRVAVVSDDRRVRTVARGLDAAVTGTIGVVVRAVETSRLDPDEARALVRRIDAHGLHTTGELRERAYELIDDAAG